MTHIPRFPRFLTLLFILAVAANVVLYLTHDKRDSYYPTSYKTLYVPTDIPALVGMRVLDRGRVELVIPTKVPYGPWKVTDDTGETYTVNGPYPYVKLKDKRHKYTVEPQASAAAGQKMVFDFGWYPSEYYKKGGRTQKDNYWLASSSIPDGKFKRYSLAFWAADYGDIDAADREEARKMLREQMGVSDSDPTVAKIEKIGCWLITQWKGHGGTPSDVIEKTKSPLKILKMVLAGEGRIWCSQHALIYHFFANMAGLPTRLVGLGGRIDNVITTGHAFAETFIPELGIWAKVDTSLNKLLILNADGQPLGSADVFNAINSGNIASLTARVCKDGAPVSQPYTEVSASDSYYYSYGAQLIYRAGRSRNQDKLSKYLIAPDFCYGLDASPLRHAYDLRRALFGIGLFFTIVWVIALVRYSLRRP